jgi:predicted nucleotide-binding protein (sugar kinase/HSP70/actin superfamily)
LIYVKKDEQQGDGGLKTRLESFVDILKFKREK